MQNADTAGFGEIIETLKTLAQIAANRLLHSDTEGIRFKTKEEMEDEKERAADAKERADSDAEEKKEQKEKDAVHAQDNGQKPKEGFLHSLVRSGVHALHKSLSNNPSKSSRRVMSDNVTFTIKGHKGDNKTEKAEDKKHSLKKGDKFSIKPYSKKPGFYLLEQYNPFKYYVVDRSIMALLRNKSEQHVKDAKTQEAPSEKPPENKSESPQENPKESQPENQPESPKQPQRHPEHDGMVSTLTGLGFKKNHANQAVHNATQKLGEKSEAKDVLKESLKNLRVKSDGDQAAFIANVRVPVNNPMLLMASLDALYFSPSVGDLLDVCSDSQFEQGPCKLTVYAASHGYCTVLDNDKLFTFSTAPVRVSKVCNDGNNKAWTLV